MKATDYLSLVPILGQIIEWFKRSPEAKAARRERKAKKLEAKLERKRIKAAAKAARRNE